MKTPSSMRLCLLATISFSFAAHACDELKSRGEAVLVNRFRDSTAMAKKLSERYSGVGNRLPLSHYPSKTIFAQSPFKGLYEIQSRPSGVDSLLDCDLGKASAKYAQLVNGGIFKRVTIKDIVKAKGSPLNWDDLRVFLDLGIKIKTPKSTSELKKRLEQDSIHIDILYPAKEMANDGPWFGVFYKETNLRSYIYGVKYVMKNDTIEYLNHELYFGFKKSDYANNYMDGASGVYIMDKVAYDNVQRLEPFIEKELE